MIRPARPQEIALLPQIENAADERYVRLGLRCVLEMPPHSIASLEEGRQRKMLWVATSPRNRVAGFALMTLNGGTAWLDQLSVLARWQGRGLGAALIDRTARRARELGYDTLYLSTYLDVPWNAPFYERRGFSSVLRGVWPGPFRLQFMIENSHGHPPWRRTIMQRPV
ncbi:MAG TPA: GNAT family N-acetyltransferase [Reyranella sp.]|jgi:GNAT superfamily N-acetyltransferase|nr:GNAT family N-acetyltransferase [Reyranella sp.]